MGNTWINLCMCEIYGYLGCRDESNFEAFEPAEDWEDCYLDDISFEKLPVHAGHDHRKKIRN